MKLRILVLALMIGAGALTACNAISGKPAVVISSPPSGSQYHEGDDVAIQSTSTDQAGVVRAELDIDGAVVRNDTPPSPQANFSIIQDWKATQGNHTVAVRAYNASGASSDPAAISIQVSPSVALNNPSTVSTPTPTNSPASVPTITPSPTTAAAPASGSTCNNNAAFVTDVTVPDGTPWAPGQAFNKIWRLSNNGTCAWSAGYQFVFISGEAMTASTVVSVPPTALGATADILVAMTAPSTPGNHSGTWRMRAPGGALFGQSVSVRISVLGAPPAPPPSSGGCSGTPAIAAFAATPGTILAGGFSTLSWGAVTNADSVEIDHGIGGVAAPGSTSVSPGLTTTYTITAHCGSNTTTLQATVMVNLILLPPPVILYNFGGHWDINFGTMDLTQSGASVSGSYFNGSCHGTVSGTVSGATLDGSWGGCGGGPIHFVGVDSNHFDGTYASTNKWCGARSGIAFVAGCGFAGHWNLRTGSNIQTADLTQIGSSVSGSYSGGTVSGTVTGWTLNGNWHIAFPALTGPFQWVIDGSDRLFRGNYGGTQWCGWRDGQTAIPSGSSCKN